MNNEERDKALYRYPDSSVLRNKLNIRNYDKLQVEERKLVALRIRSGVPSGKFDLSHLQAIHKHLFQDVYEWAGEIRQVDISKGESWFHPHGRIEMGMADVQKRLSDQKYLRDLPSGKFALEAAEFIGDVNCLHPFREGNGRTQFHYLKQLGQQAGHKIDLTRFDRKSWIQASIEANKFNCERMAACIKAAIADGDKDRDQKKARLQDSAKRINAAKGQGTAQKTNKSGNKLS